MDALGISIFESFNGDHLTTFVIHSQYIFFNFSFDEIIAVDFDPVVDTSPDEIDLLNGN